MRNLLNPADQSALVERLKTLHPGSRRNWGQMTIHQVLPHMADPLRLALGEKSATHNKSAFYNTFFGRMMAFYVPWPKGAPTAQEFIPGKGCTEPTSFEKDRNVLLQTLDRFTIHGSRSDYQPNPVFGNLSRRGWGRLMWRHVDHHLRQFSA